MVQMYVQMQLLATCREEPQKAKVFFIAAVYRAYVAVYGCAVSATAWELGLRVPDRRVPTRPDTAPSRSAVCWFSFLLYHTRYGYATVR